jgi:hypothetical protein
MARNIVRSNVKKYTREEWKALDTRTLKQKADAKTRSEARKKVKDIQPAPSPVVRVQP